MLGINFPEYWSNMSTQLHVEQMSPLGYGGLDPNLCINRSVTLRPTDLPRGSCGLRTRPMVAASGIGGFLRFDHGLVEVMGTHLLADGDHLVLPTLDTPLQDLTSLSNTDFSKCFVEVDIVAMSISGMEQQHTLVVVPFQAQKYARSCEYHLTHFDFRPLAPPHIT